MRNLIEVVIADNGSSLSQRRDEEHNCDQNGQQFSRGFSNDLPCGDHVFRSVLVFTFNHSAVRLQELR